LLLAVLAWWFVKGVLKSRLNQPKRAESIKGEDMVACARCGVNMPRSEAREEGGKYFCLNAAQCVK
jgi:formylmethanofuran dehydrogenase subunit E